jgi:hypothetical protein
MLDSKKYFKPEIIEFNLMTLNLTAVKQSYNFKPACRQAGFKL